MGWARSLGQLEDVRVVADALLPRVWASDAEYVGDKVQILDAGHVVVQVGVIGDVGQLPLAGQGIGLDGIGRRW